MLVISGYLLYVYAGLPDWVELGGRWAVSRDGFFYGVLATLALFNGLRFPLSRLFSGQSGVRIWYNGVLIFLHLFGLVALAFVSQLNSLDRFDYGQVGFTITGSLLLLVLWFAGFPLVRWLQKKPAEAGS